jgi:hypothetical protein
MFKPDLDPLPPPKLMLPDPLSKLKLVCPPDKLSASSYEYDPPDPPDDMEVTRDVVVKVLDDPSPMSI